MAGVRVRAAGGSLFFVEMVGRAPLGQAQSGKSRRARYQAEATDDDRPDAACPVSYYLDGAKIRTGPRGINGEILASEVEAVEVYRRASETPAEFLDSYSRCGAVVIWRKRGP